MKMRDVLTKIHEGRTVGALSREMNIRESTLRAMLDLMVWKGYLQEIPCWSDCRMCPLKCPHHTFMTGIRMYVLTEKGMEYLKERDAEKRAAETAK